MTVVVAAHTEEGIVLAADTLTTDGQVKMYSTTSKMHVAGPYVIATAGSKRVGQVIRHHTVWPAWPPTPEEGQPVPGVEEFLVTQVVPAIQQACADGGVLNIADGVQTFDATVMIVLANTIAEVDTDGCVHIERAGRWAIGSGAQFALGFLGDAGPWTHQDVIDSARRAMRASLGCGGGVDVITIPADEPATT